MYLTVPQTAAILTVGEAKVRALIRSGALTAERLSPRCTRVLISSLPIAEDLRQKLIDASLVGLPADQRAALLATLQLAKPPKRAKAKRK